MIIIRSGGGSDDAAADNTYTSLKDLTTPESPTYGRKDSWREIPMKDPLIQQAAWAWAWAWAYLPPVTAERDPSHFAKWKDGLFGCFNDVVNAIINNCFLRV